jgi:hypothetical protein
MMTTEFPQELRSALPRTLHEFWYFIVCAEGIPLGWGQEKCDEFARHWWPLVYCKCKGIEQGAQWDRLGWLAARYARDLSVRDLADELWEVMQASPQDHRNPWRRHHAVDIAARAHRFIERADERLSRWLHESGAYAWALSVTRALPGHPAPRPERVPGQRRMRKPGRAG